METQNKRYNFCLVVDDFGVKYTRKEDANFLIQSLCTEYELHEDWEGTLYIGMTYGGIIKNVQLNYPCRDILKTH